MPTGKPTETVTTPPTYPPTFSPTAAPPNVCILWISLDDAHGSYELWQSSFLKYDGNFQTDDDFDYYSGYIPFIYALEEAGFDPSKPALTFGLRYGPGATFSAVPGKLNADGGLIPCEIDSPGSGPCLSTRGWEIGLSAKSYFNSAFSLDAASWTAPLGSSMTNECFPESEWPAVDVINSRVRPIAFTGEGRKHNNVPPPSFHAPPPLPHESVEFTLTLQDGSGEGWWNTLKLHPNQYVLDDGENILHRGTLVGQAETTEKFRLKDGSYFLRFLGNHDSDADDDSWILKLKDDEIASGGRYDRISFTVSHGQVSSIEMENALTIFESFSSSPLPLGEFQGLLSQERFHLLMNDPDLIQAEAAIYKELFANNPALTNALHRLSSSSSSSSGQSSLLSSPYEVGGLILVSTMLGMATMWGVMKYFNSPFKNSNYNPVMDHSQPAAAIQVELEKSIPNKVQDCQL